MNLLSVENIDVCYGDVQVIWNCSLEVHRGEVVALFGGNSVGKTTTLRAISRLIELKAGRIVFDGREISRMEAHEVTGLGLAHVPEGRRIFANLTVAENLDLGAYQQYFAGQLEDYEYPAEGIEEALKGVPQMAR